MCTSDSGQKKNGVARYAAVPFVVGIFEFQVNAVDEKLARNLDAYYEEALGKSFHYAQIDGDECTGCETCRDRCQIEAIAIIEEKAVVNLNRCIGCGLCVSTCPTDAVRLMKKSEDRQYVPPETGMETYIRIARERGKSEGGGNGLRGRGGTPSPGLP